MSDREGWHTQATVIDLLREAGVPFSCHEHEHVMTCEAQEAALAHVEGRVTKNLFLRDKKRRFYLVTALPDTEVNLKALSLRLGIGSGNLSWAPPEALSSILGVEPGCVTPLGLANREASARVVALLDSRLKTDAGRRFFVHPIVNSASVLLDAAGLETFLRAVGRDPVYVDFAAVDATGAPLRNDLKHLVPPPPEPAAAAASGAPSESTGQEEGSSNNG